jgi:hypothetical protein
MNNKSKSNWNKKLMLSLSVCVLSATALHAQKTYLQAGINLANTSVSSNGNVDKNRVLNSFNVGFISAFPLSKTVNFETGLLLTGKGAKEDRYYTASTTDNYTKRSINPIYLEVPLNIAVKIPMDTKNALSLYGGPYVAAGILGQVKGESKFLGVSSSFSNDVEFNNDDPFTSQQEGASNSRLRRFDTGLNFGAAFTLDKFIIKANYGLGLSKIGSNESNTNDNNKHRVLGFSVGFAL